MGMGEQGSLHVVWDYQSKWAIPDIFRGRLIVLGTGGTYCLKLSGAQQYVWVEGGNAFGPADCVWNDSEEVVWEEMVQLESLKTGTALFYHPHSGRRISVGELVY